jgi:hypothetical protein
MGSVSTSLEFGSNLAQPLLDAWRAPLAPNAPILRAKGPPRRESL